MVGQEELKKLFKKHFNEDPKEVVALKAHASPRKIYRLIGEKHQAIGVENSDVTENKSFIYLSMHFRSRSLPVPEIYAQDLSGLYYLQEDLGDTTLYDLLFQRRTKENFFPLEIEDYYNKVVSLLPEFQIAASEGIDYTKTHGFSVFSKKQMLSDMEYFRLQYLDHIGFAYDHGALKSDFERFAAYLSEEKSEYFMYRDFQSRNIMVRDSKLYFIDYQAGCMGPLQYDPASLLFQAQARIPCDARDRILGVYLSKLGSYAKIDKHKFLKYYYAFVVLRIMQALGTYGLRGLKERKQYFIDSIEYALINLRYVFRTQGLPIEMPEFEKFIRELDKVKEEKLTLNIYSFSYKLATGTPLNQHGGGFVFDCRCLPNPGREEQYKTKSGLDPEVIEYLERLPDVQDFFKKIAAVVEQSVEAYIKRKFLNLSVSFGCTGGQHRSVFFAEKLAAFIKEKYDINVFVQHISKDLWMKQP